MFCGLRREWANLTLCNNLGLHSHRRCLSRLSRNCEWNEVHTNVDIHTLVQELWDRYNSLISWDNQELKIFSHHKWWLVKCLRTEWECNHSTFKNEARHSHFFWLNTYLPTCFQELWDETRTGRECDRQDECTLHSLVISCCLGENVNQA